MGECSFWYRPTRVVPDQRPLNGRCCCCCCDPPTFSWEEDVRLLLHQLSSASLTNLVKISMQVIIVIMNLDWMSFLHETYLYLVSARTVVEK